MNGSERVSAEATVFFSPLSAVCWLTEEGLNCVIVRVLPRVEDWGGGTSHYSNKLREMEVGSRGVVVAGFRLERLEEKTFLKKNHK